MKLPSQTSRALYGKAAVAICLLLAGCGGEASTTVQGTITYDGKPVTTGVINFQAANGKTFGGAIGSDGGYSYEMPPGDYQVRIDAPGEMPPWKEGDPEPKLPPRQMPGEYASYETSALKVTVTGDSTQQQDFTLP